MNIALLLGLADTEESFRKQVLWSDCLSVYGFQGANLEEQGAEIDTQWHSNYWPTVGAALCALAAEVGAHHGVSVYRRATLKDIVEATGETRGNDAVVVLAHWKGPDVKGEDVKGGLTVGGLLNSVSGHEASLAQWIGNRIEWTKRRQARWWEEGAALGSVCEILNDALRAEFVDEELERDYGFVDVVVENEGIRRSKRRALLDMMLGEHIVPGNRLELCDGFHDADAVLGAVSETFEGILDLTTCQSTYLADRIGREREATIRTVSFPYEQNPVWACQCLRIFIPALCRGIGYSSAREYASRRLSELLAAGEERESS